MLYQSYVCYNAPGCINKMRSTNERSHDNEKGILYGVGVGLGDPELMTLLAVKTIKNCSTTTARSLRQQKNSAAIKAIK